jgi:hypothetical protein
MEGPDLFRNLDPSRISRSKAEETLLYVRYLLNREKQPAKIRVYESLKAILEARLEELTEREVLPPIATTAAKQPGLEVGQESIPPGADGLRHL